MGDSPTDKPIIFIKPPSVRRQVGRNGEKVIVPIPKRDSCVHPECEAVIWLSKGGQNLTVAEAETRIGWVTVGLDVTLRDIQTSLKKAGHPWTISKVFPDSAILGPWMSRDEFPNFMDTDFHLRQGDTIRQNGKPREMILSPAQAISYASQLFVLSPGDILFTGTPAGVGPVKAGDMLKLDWGKINFEVHWQE